MDTFSLQNIHMLAFIKDFQHLSRFAPPSPNITFL